jgi:hypothetical protein
MYQSWVNIFKSISGVTAHPAARLVQVVGMGLFAYRFPSGGWQRGRELELQRAKFDFEREVATREEA